MEERGLSLWGVKVVGPLMWNRFLGSGPLFLLYHCPFLFSFTFFNKFWSLTVLREINFFCTLFYRVLMYHFLLHYVLCTNFCSVTCLYLHFIVVDWVFLGNLLKSLHLSLYWDSFLGQDHCLHMTYNFCLAASFDGVAIQRLCWLLCFAKVVGCFISNLDLQCRK